jgi:regulatory protein
LKAEENGGEGSPAGKDPLAACMNRALRILGIRQFSVKELRTRLLEKGEASENIEPAIARLLELGFLDDAKYAVVIVRRLAAKGYGKARVVQELRRRGIDRELWDNVLGELPGADDENDRLDCLLRQKLPEEPDRSDVKKAVDYLARRGFSWSEIQAALRRIADDT